MCGRKLKKIQFVYKYTNGRLTHTKNFENSQINSKWISNTDPKNLKYKVAFLYPRET